MAHAADMLRPRPRANRECIAATSGGSRRRAGGQSTPTRPNRDRAGCATIGLSRPGMAARWMVMMICAPPRSGDAARGDGGIPLAAPQGHGGGMTLAPVSLFTESPWASSVTWERILVGNLEARGQQRDPFRPMVARGLRIGWATQVRVTHGAGTRPDGVGEGPRGSPMTATSIAWMPRWRISSKTLRTHCRASLPGVPEARVPRVSPGRADCLGSVGRAVTRSAGQGIRDLARHRSLTDGHNGKRWPAPDGDPTRPTPGRQGACGRRVGNPICLGPPTHQGRWRQHSAGQTRTPSRNRTAGWRNQGFHG